MEDRTINQIAKSAMRQCGLHAGDTSKLEDFLGYVNTADRLMVTQAEVDWNRRERHHNLVAKKHIYRLSIDMRKVSAVSAIYGNIPYPLHEVKAKDDWTALTSLQAYSSVRPTHYYMNGRKELELFPTPASDVHDGLIVQYEPRIRFRSRPDIETMATVDGRTNAIRTDISVPADRLDSKLFYDGYAYDIIDIKNTNSPYMVFTDQVIRAYSGDPIQIIIGDVPYCPEEYNDALKSYCSWQYYLRQKDLNTAAGYGRLFEKRKREFREEYAETTTNYMSGDPKGIINQFVLPPNFIGGI